MPTNFNKLIFIKKFNNYFNRKVLGATFLFQYEGARQNYDGYNSITSEQIPVEAIEFVNVGTFWRANIDLSRFVAIGKEPFNIVKPDASYTLTYNKYSQILTITTTNAPFDFLLEFSHENYGMLKFEDINFNPNDGITTDIVINNLSFEADYLLVLDSQENIISRWFVLETVRTRNLQAKIMLRRDVIYDNLDDLMNSPIFVQKGMLDDEDPLAVNNEGMNVNQIKTKETRLFDSLGKMSWAILYIAKNTPDTETTMSSTKIKISGNRVHTNKQNFDIVAIPVLDFAGEYNELRIIKPDGTSFDTISVLTAQHLSDICQQLGTNLYDIQILPYCPVPECITQDLELDLRELLNPTEGTGFDYILFNTDKIGVCIYILENSFETNLYPESGTITTSLTRKEASNLQLFRFVSPNYQGQFDFNIGKNDNKCENIKAYCSYKPYTPFLKIAPEFKKFYGSNFKDARGLICGGDFSIGAISDAWINFQLNNKNYQNIFNREIQNMDFNFDISIRNQILSGGVGILAGAAAGAAGGAMVAGPWGAIAGAGVGAITSAFGAAMDTFTMAEQYKENKDLAIDKFNYQLGNIKALPYTLTKVSSIDYVSKIWPTVEEYNCTAEELSAFRNKIKYESMTVMRIDKISNYYHKFEDLCYFKGELIRNENIAADHHVLMAIYEELLKGVYL